jgi:hypothetical protein
MEVAVRANPGSNLKTEETKHLKKLKKIIKKSKSKKNSKIISKKMFKSK